VSHVFNNRVRALTAALWAAAVGAVLIGPQPAAAAAPSSTGAAPAQPEISGYPITLTPTIGERPWGFHVTDHEVVSRSREIRVTIDITEIARFVVVTEPTNCQRAGAVISCLGTGPLAIFGMKVKPTAQARVGDVGKVHLTANIGDLPPVKKDVSAQVIASVDLSIISTDGSATDSSASKTVKPSDRVKVPWLIHNSGTLISQGIKVNMHYRYGVELKRFDNCQYSETFYIYTSAYCTFAGEIRPGASYEVVDDAGAPVLAAEVRHDAFTGPYSFHMDVWPVDSAPAVDSVRGEQPRSGHEAVLREVATSVVEYPGDNNSASYTWNVVGGLHDIAAQGATPHGRAGDTVTLSVGARNIGKATVIDLANNVALVFLVTLPEGVEVVGELPRRCVRYVPNNRYICRTYPALMTQDSFLADFKVRLTRDPGPDGMFGRVDLGNRDSWTLGYDDDRRGDNHARILITLPGTNDAGTDGGLPVTGVKVSLIVAGGLALALAGFAFYRLGRHRRLPAA
jgi:hypothetical protein